MPAAGRGYDVTLLDLSAALLAEARRHFAETVIVPVLITSRPVRLRGGGAGNPPAAGWGCRETRRLRVGGDPG